MASRIQAFDRPNVISWEPGQDTDDGSLTFGGRVWRYIRASIGTTEMLWLTLHTRFDHTAGTKCLSETGH